MSRRMRMVWGLVTVAMLVAAPQVHAQGQGQGRGNFGGGFGMGRMGGGGGLLGLAQMEPIQKELGIEKDSAEAAEIKKLAEAQGKERQEETAKVTGGDFTVFQNASPEERQKLMAKLGEINTRLTAKYGPDLKKLLKAEQYTRLQQIGWQIAGTAAFADADLIKSLELSKEQQEKLATVNSDFAKKQQELFQAAFQGGGGGGGPAAFEEMQKKTAEITKERDEKAKSILSKDQNEKYAMLLGKPFDVALLRPQGFGPGGRGQGGPGGGRRNGNKTEEKSDEKKE